MQKVKRVYYARYGLKRYLSENQDGSFTIEGECRYTRGAEGMFDADGGILDGNALFVGADYGFGKILSIKVEPSGKTGFFKLLVETEKTCKLLVETEKP